MGWVPLAPFERFHPWYGRGFNNTIIVNNVTVVNNFRNARFVNGRNGVTSVDANDFGRGRAINTNNFVRASNNDLARAGSVQGRLPFTASADARRMSDRSVNTQSMPRVSENTRFAQRAPSQASVQASQAAQGRPAQTFGQRSNSPAAVGNSGGNTGGWRPLNGAASNGNAQVPQGNPGGNTSNGSGWRTFSGGAPNAPANGVGRNNAAPAPTAVSSELAAAGGPDQPAHRSGTRTFAAGEPSRAASWRRVRHRLARKAEADSGGNRGGNNGGGHGNNNKR